MNLFQFNNKKPAQEGAGRPVRRVDRVIDGVAVCPGDPRLLGATELRDGVNFAVQSMNATACQLMLFHPEQAEPYALITIPETYRVGNVWAVLVLGLEPGKFEYAYRMDGPVDKKKGLVFNRNKFLLDPYAKAVTGKTRWGHDCGKVYHGLLPRDEFDWQGVPKPEIPITDAIMYELHPRFYTQHPSSRVIHPGTYDGIREKIPYLKALGVTSIELMPVFQFDETNNRRVVNGNTLLESWGYNTVSYFAPNAAYASPEQGREGTELKTLIRELHRNGMEVILDVVYNHTAEGDHQGPFNSMKGLDNTTYYLLTPEGSYHNYSGCGNTVNCNHPMVAQLILDSLRYWTVHYQVDGFRFDLASILTRGEDGAPMPDPPLIKAISRDPILSKVKLIGEVWDAAGLYQIGNFPANHRWAEWNGQYRDRVRAFLKGDCWKSADAALAIVGSPDIYDREDSQYLSYRSSINLIDCHDGFTLYDIYAYNGKHNLANGWNNNDGENNNYSWNCGAEGPTEDVQIEALRHKMIRNAVTTLMCSRGTPLFFGGDEFGNSQLGNNNCYCQDSDLSYLHWDDLDKNRDIYDFFRFVIAYRKNHRAIRESLPAGPSGFGSCTPRTADATLPESPHNAHTITVLFSGMDGDREDIVLLALNTYWESAAITLPEHIRWELTVNTADREGDYCRPEGTGPEIRSGFVMEPRSALILTGQKKV